MEQNPVSREPKAKYQRQSHLGDTSRILYRPRALEDLTKQDQKRRY